MEQTEQTIMKSLTREERLSLLSEWLMRAADEDPGIFAFSDLQEWQVQRVNPGQGNC